MIPKFKIGQVVYRQSFGIGSFIKTPVYELEPSADKKEWVCKVDCVPQQPGLFNWVSENNLYFSLTKLKAHWIRVILDIKDREEEM